MKILAGGRWSDGFLDYHRLPGEYRVRTIAVLNLSTIDGLYFVRPRSLGLIWNYLVEFGLSGVLRRARSRFAEAGRNDKYLSCGIGEIVEAPTLNPDLPVGSHVLFIAPSHPPCAERLCLPRALLRRTTAFRDYARDGNLLVGVPPPELPPAANWPDVRGWSPHSGVVLDAGVVDRCFDDADTLIANIDWSSARKLAPSSTAIADLSPGGERRDRLILVGYGNYAKTVILPNLPRKLRITRIHEVDPTQIGPTPAKGHTWSTSPALLPADRPQAVFIAGFHHDHAELAIDALDRGAYAIAEKPVATRAEQIAPLVSAIERSPRYFACFHKRYSAFTTLALADLQAVAGSAIDYHCIVHEAPLPTLHWYRWSNSRSRLVSNGCHWIDHFLFLNAFAEPNGYHLIAGGDGVLNVVIELANGASFTMALSDRGSSRVGVRDYVELRAGARTVKIIDGSRYEAESNTRVLRRARIGRADSYRRMYREIGRRICAGETGDTPESVRLSATLVLDLEAMLKTSDE